MTHTIADAVGNAIEAMRADADMNELLDCLGQLGGRHIEDLSVDEARRQPTMADAVKALLARRGQSSDPARLVPGISARDTTIPGAAAPVPARIYTPPGAMTFPVIVYFHGGGWVIGDKEVYDGGARGLADAANAIVVSVDYRQAPEHRFPAAWDDAYVAYRWVTQHADVFGGDTRRVALAGESAGGNLALATAIAARDAGLPAPAHALAVYPVTQTSVNTESYVENALAKPLNRAMVEWFVDQLVRSKDDLQDARLQLVDARLEGLCPVSLVTADIDPLRGDGVRMEDALRRARVPVERRHYDGVTHEFFGCAAVLEKARQAQDWAGARLLEAFAAA